jgi:hypothetical protein
MDRNASSCLPYHRDGRAARSRPPAPRIAGCRFIYERAVLKWYGHSRAVQQLGPPQAARGSCQFAAKLQHNARFLRHDVSLRGHGRVRAGAALRGAAARAACARGRAFRRDLATVVRPTDGGGNARTGGFTRAACARSDARCARARRGVGRCRHRGTLAAPSAVLGATPRALRPRAPKAAVSRSSSVASCGCPALILPPRVRPCRRSPAASCRQRRWPRCPSSRCEPAPPRSPRSVARGPRRWGVAPRRRAADLDCRTSPPHFTEQGARGDADPGCLQRRDRHRGQRGACARYQRRAARSSAHRVVPPRSKCGRLR